MMYLLLFVYFLALSAVLVFSLGQLHLTFSFLRAQHKEKDSVFIESPPLPTSLPLVTVQLPLFNEKYVVERLLEAVAQLEYPPERLEVQVLDDSTDETTELATKKITALRQKTGIDFVLIRRPERTGFKAGALAYGLEWARGEFIAIFDADFLPPPDFLRHTLPHFANPQVGMVQTRWGHVNRLYSALTQAQAFALDAHFTIEQVGRAQAGYFLNFNGTAGIWRKTCITAAGGWQADTLTEDLDLSYRAQLAGWKFRYLPHVASPAELPVTMLAVKSQQFRWNKGAAETARKLLGKVWQQPLSYAHKLHAFFHLANSSVFVCLLIAALLSVPVLFVKSVVPALAPALHFGGVFVVGFLAMLFFYWTATRSLAPRISVRAFAGQFVKFLLVYMGLTLHNAVAVAEGWAGRKSPFVRTPKFNVRKASDTWKGNVYLQHGWSWGTLAEGFLALYFLAGIALGILLLEVGLLPFHTLLFASFATVFYQSVRSA